MEQIMLAMGGWQEKCKQGTATEIECYLNNKLR